MNSFLSDYDFNEGASVHYEFYKSQPFNDLCSQIKWIKNLKINEKLIDILSILQDIYCIQQNHDKNFT